MTHTPTNSTGPATGAPTGALVPASTNLPTHVPADATDAAWSQLVARHDAAAPSILEPVTRAVAKVAKAKAAPVATAAAPSKARRTKAGALRHPDWTTVTDRMVVHFHLVPADATPDATDHTLRTVCGARFWPTDGPGARPGWDRTTDPNLALVSCASCGRTSTWSALTDGAPLGAAKPRKPGALTAAQLAARAALMAKPRKPRVAKAKAITTGAAKAITTGATGAA